MGKDAPSAPSAQQLAAGQVINQITPFGSTTFGNVNPQTGQFTPLSGAITQKVQESPFQQTFRQGREALSLGLLGELGGLNFSQPQAPQGGAKGGGLSQLVADRGAPTSPKGGNAPVAGQQQSVTGGGLPSQQLPPPSGGTGQFLSGGLEVFSPEQIQEQGLISQFAVGKPPGELIGATANGMPLYRPEGQQVTQGGYTPTPQTQSPLQVATGGEGGLLGARARTAQEIRNILPSAQDRSGLPNLLGVGDVESRLTTPFTQDFTGAAQQAQESTYNRVSNLLAPRFQEQTENLDQQLADRGIPVGSEAYKREKNRLEEQQSRLLQDTAFGAVQAGNLESERLARLGLATRGQQLGEGLSLAGLAGQQRGQLFGEQTTQLEQALQKQLALANLEGAQRAQRFGELGSLFGLPGSSFQPVPIPQLGTNPAAQSAALQQQAAAQNNAGKGGFGQLIGTLGGAFLGR